VTSIVLAFLLGLLLGGLACLFGLAVLSRKMRRLALGRAVRGAREQMPTAEKVVAVIQKGKEGNGRVVIE
jgi:hypothetical protein